MDDVNVAEEGPNRKFCNARFFYAAWQCDISAQSAIVCMIILMDKLHGFGRVRGSRLNPLH